MDKQRLLTNDEFLENDDLNERYNQINYYGKIKRNSEKLSRRYNVGIPKKLFNSFDSIVKK